MYPSDFSEDENHQIDSLSLAEACQEFALYQPAKDAFFSIFPPMMMPNLPTQSNSP